MAVLVPVVFVFVSFGGSNQNNPNISGGGYLSFDAKVLMAAQAVDFVDNTPTRLSQSITTEDWGYRFVLNNGDIVEIGDSTTPEFKAHIKTIRWNGVADFSMWLEGGTFVPTLTDDVVSFNFNDDILVQIYEISPTERLPEGGIEYDITLFSRPAQSNVKFNVDWNGLTFTKILPLDAEYTQAACIEEWGIELSPFTITPTSIISTITSETLKIREEYKINSYVGIAKTNYHDKTHIGNNVFYSTISRSYLNIHRGEMTDSLGATSWVEDIVLNESKKELTFELDRAWLRNATYPIYHLVGVDPAYTEDMDYFGTGLTEAVSATFYDYDIYTNHGIPKGAIAEIIISNDDGGKEYGAGVRTDGSSVIRNYDLHEAESGGRTTVRQFVTVHTTTGLIETRQEENTDIIFTIVGYWENVTFTEVGTNETASTANTWEEEELTGVPANRVVHMVFGWWLLGDDTQGRGGVRETSSSVNRYVTIHEQEGGGVSQVDMMTVTDGSSKIDIYVADTASNNFRMRCSGYFGSELVFNEDYVGINVEVPASTWQIEDLSAYLDEDGRVVDLLLVHDSVSNERTIGARGGDDTTTNRYILEHESEYPASPADTGFGISALTNSSGEIYLYASNVASDGFMYTGYFEAGGAAGSPDISNTPSTKSFGVVAASSTYWSDGAEPSWPLVDGDAYFTVTNNSGAAVDIDIKATNFTGGDGWTITASSPGSNTVRLTVFEEGDGSGDGLVLTTGDQAFIVSLADSGDKDWELKLETGTFTDGALKTSTITMTAALSFIWVALRRRFDEIFSNDVLISRLFRN